MTVKKLTIRELALSSALAAISAIVQLIHIGYQSPQWGMLIDIVAVSWIVAFFLFGIRSCFLVSLLGALIITLFAPDTWLGASMKWLATMPIWASLYFFIVIRKVKISDYQNVTRLILPAAVGLLIRSLLLIPLNYYYAIPIWTGMTTQQAISAIPWYIIAGFNTIQGVLDIALAWIIVFRFRIVRYASWYK